MASIATILNDPTTGLIPYLELKLATDWNRFQLRNWTFIDAEDNRSGFRLRESVTQEQTWDSFKASWTITLGKVFSMDDPTLSQVAGGQFREQIDNLIIHWSRGVCPSLCEPITRIVGMNDIEQNRNVSSENDGAWNIVVVREFEFSYYLDYQAC
jgi:hypothetical protein